MTRTVTWDRAENVLLTPKGRIKPRSGMNHKFNCNLEDARHIVWRDLAETFREINETLSYTLEGPISLTVKADYDRRNAWRPFLYRSDTFSYWEEWGLVLDSDYGHPAREDESGAVAAIGPLLQANEGELLEINWNVNGFDGPYIDLKARFPRDRTIGQIVALSFIFDSLIAYGSVTPGSPDGAFALVTAGMPDALLGQPESQWLEVKQKGYGLQNDRQKHELALDLAAFANCDDGGLIVIGLATSKDPGGQDTISAANGCAPGSLNVDSYAEVVKNRVVPAIEGLNIRVVAHKGRHFLAALVPPQPQQFKPFLVRGGLVSADRVSGAAFTIPQRVGSEKWNMSAEAVHSQLVAARLALRKTDG
ncbi:AlbA family DNA-binding domain-containing protein [Micromonospora sp. LA-10]|uniref:AlbA family DNA-binding domain-containing protein n=1 Tax=Micromonospora sp. LA-10 TaxID=3446364 RepID=UPI003F7076F2